MYQKFKEALLKATTKEHRDEIMELKFGCNILFNNGIILGVDCRKLEGKICWETESLEIFTVIRPDGNNIYEVERKRIVEILGRDITLEDVLKVNFERVKKTYNVNTISECLEYEGVEEIVSTWQIGKPAHKQSNETLEAIYNLIK